MKRNYPPQSHMRHLVVSLTAMSLVLATIIIVLSQGQDPKDLKGKTKQVLVVPNGTVNAGAIEFREDPNHQGDPTPSPTPTPSPDASPTPSPDASPTPSPGGTPTPTPTPGGSPTPTPTATPGAYQVTRTEGASIIPGDTDIGSQFDDGTTNIELPFAYTLYDLSFTSASVSSNGVLEFNSDVADSRVSCMPYRFFNYSILPLWGDLRTDSGGVFTSITGAAPNRVFNIEWRAQFIYGGEAHFEVQLYEGETRFDVIYDDVANGGSDAAIGVQRILGDSYTEYSCNGGSPINPGTRLTFNLNPGSYPAPPPLQITPAAINIAVNTLLGQQNVQLRVMRTNADGSTEDVTTADGTNYQSSDSSVAIVDGVGTVAGSGAGSASIVVTNGNSSGEAPVTVSVFSPGGSSSVVIPGTANKVAVSGNYAYVAAGTAGLQVIDISNRQSPSIVGALDTAGNAENIAVAGNLAYLADGVGGLCVIDVSNSLSPTLLGVVNTPGDAQDVVVENGRAYVADGTAGLQIIDVNNPASPFLTGTFDTQGSAQGTAVSDGLALVISGAGSSGDSVFRVVDVSNPAAPQEVANMSLPGTAEQLFVRSRFAYVGRLTGGLAVVDFSTSSRPKIVTSDNFFPMTDAASSGRYAFFSTAPFFFGIPIYDLDDPSRPRYSGTVSFSGSGGYQGTGIAMDSRYVYQTATFDDSQSGLRTSRLFIAQYQATAPVTIDTAGIAPTVTISTPQDGESVIEGSELLVAATAADDVQVASVRFTINDVIVATDVAGPYQFTYDVPRVLGNLVIRATAIDLAGNTGESQVVIVPRIPDPPPTVEIYQPEEGAELTQGLTANLQAAGIDNGSISKLEYFVNGVKVSEDPYGFITFDVPLGISSVTLEVRATDNLGQTGSATRTVAVVPYTGPTTTVIGRVVDGPGVPVAGLTVSVFNVFTMQTGADGTFSFSGVPTIRNAIPAHVSGTFNGRTISRDFQAVYPESDVTDLGDLMLTRQHSRSFFQGPPTAVASSGTLTYVANGEDFFFGFEDSNQIYWPGGFFGIFNGRLGDGVLIPWNDNTFTLPTYLGVKSADVSLGHVYAQFKEQPGTVTDMFFAFNSNTFRFQPQTRTLETGLTVECDGIAAANDGVGDHLPMLAFLGTTEQGAALNVRFGDGADGYNAPVVLPVEAGEQLRTPRLRDINRDRLMDLLLIRQVSPTESRLVVYPRVGPTEFGAPVESPITVRSAPATPATVDYAIAEFDATHATTVAVLGDDRVRFYTSDNSGALTPGGELLLPSGAIPLSLAATSYHRNDPPYTNALASVVVSTVAADSPGSRAAYVFLSQGSGFEPARVYGYMVPETAETNNARVFISGLNGFGNAEVVLVDGQYVTVLYDMLPLYDLF